MKYAVQKTKILKSSTESSISTSLIHCIASVGNCKQVRTSVLNLIIHQLDVAGVGNEDLKSAVVVGLLHNSLKSLLHWRWLNFWLTVQTGISDLDLVFVSHSFHCGWMKRLFGTGSPLIQFLRIWCWRWRIWICKNVSRKPCVSKCLAALRCGSAIRRKVSIILEELDEAGNDTCRLVTWEFPLRTDSASLNFWLTHTIYFILQILYSASEFQDSVLLLD